MIPIFGLIASVVVVDMVPSFFGILPIDILRDSSLSLSATAYFIRLTFSILVWGIQVKISVAETNIPIITITSKISTIVKPYFGRRDCLFIENFYYQCRFYLFFLIFKYEIYFFRICFSHIHISFFLIFRYICRDDLSIPYCMNEFWYSRNKHDGSAQAHIYSD